MTDQCDAIYKRHPLGTDTIERVRCTFILGHPAAKHSWATLKAQDEADAEAERQRAQAWRLDPSFQTILSAIDKGDADPYLEAILSAAHNRKRALRGVRGFPDLRGERVRA